MPLLNMAVWNGTAENTNFAGDSMYFKPLPALCVF